MFAWSKLPESLYPLPIAFPPIEMCEKWLYLIKTHLCFHPKQGNAKLLLSFSNHLQGALVLRTILCSLLESASKSSEKENAFPINFTMHFTNVC